MWDLREIGRGLVCVRNSTQFGQVLLFMIHPSNECSNNIQPFPNPLNLYSDKISLQVVPKPLPPKKKQDKPYQLTTNYQLTIFCPFLSISALHPSAQVRSHSTWSASPWRCSARSCWRRALWRWRCCPSSRGPGRRTEMPWGPWGLSLWQFTSVTYPLVMSK